jgi:outer membrane protein assembly factor BamB
MRAISSATAALFAAAGFCVLLADWASTGGNPQRDGWARGETRLSRETVSGIRQLYKVHFDNEPRGLDALTTPINLTRIITWKGFKELLFIGGSSDVVYALDSDLNRVYFTAPLVKTRASSPAPTVLCPGGLASIAISGGTAPAMRGGGGRGRGPGGPPPGMGRGRGPQPAVWAVASDGDLYTIRQQDGDITSVPPAKFVPAHSKISGLNVNNDVIYAATLDECNGSPNALYAIDTSNAEKPVTTFPTGGAGFSGSGGIAIGADGTVYGQIAAGHGDSFGAFRDTVVALAPKTLAPKDYFTPSGTRETPGKNAESASVTPVVFSWKGKDVIAAASSDGRLFLLDSASLGGADHHTPLFETGLIATEDSGYSGNGFRGSFATFEDAANNNTRWLFAAMSGPTAATFPTANGKAQTGAIVAFIVEDQGGKPALVPRWISRDITMPSSPAVTTSGLVFALSTGESARTAKPDGSPYTVAEKQQMAKPAVLYAFDAANGKELWSSGNGAATFSHAGISVNEGRVYFSTHDNTLYCYGIYEEH